MEKSISIIIVEDQEFVRKGFISLLEEQNELKIIGEAENGEKLLEILPNNVPEIILMDIEMPVMDGILAAKKVREKYPHVKIIFLSMHFDMEFYNEFKMLGYNGYISKSATLELVIRALKLAVQLGNCFEITEILLQKDLEFNKRNNQKVKKYDLTLKELEILDLLCCGKSNKEMASILNVSLRAVEHHKTALYRKTNFISAAELISYGLKIGLG